MKGGALPGDVALELRAVDRLFTPPMETPKISSPLSLSSVQIISETLFGSIEGLETKIGWKHLPGLHKLIRSETHVFENPFITVLVFSRLTVSSSFWVCLDITRRRR